MYIYKSPKVVNEYKFDIRTIISVPQELTFNTSKVGLWGIFWYKGSITNIWGID